MRILSWIPFFRATPDATPHGSALGLSDKSRVKALRGGGATQVRDVLGRLATCRRRVNLWRDSLRSQVADGRTKLLLDYIGSHEEHIEACLARYSSVKANAILDTWLPYGIDRALLDVLEQGLELNPSMSIEDVVRLMLQVDRALMELYSRLASAPLLPPRVRELFGDLLELEKSKDRMVSLALLDD